MITSALLIFAISFLSCLVVIPYNIKYIKKIGLVVRDQNKKNKPLIPISGGISVMIGIFLGLMAYAFIRTFFYHDDLMLFPIFISLTTIFIITFIGFVDDSIIRKNKEESGGLKQWQKPLLTLVAAVPLMALNVGVSSMSFPFIGNVDLGILYPLLFVPITVVIASNMVNLLAGINGLEAGLGIIYMGMLGLFAIVHKNYFVAVLALTTFASLIAFMKYNWMPAKILPGDSLTYLLGAVLACIAIVGNMEKAVMIVAIPFAIEFFLKARSKFKAPSYGYYKNGKVASLSGRKIYSLVHFFSRTEKFNEKQITISLMAFEFLISLAIWII